MNIIKTNEMAGNRECIVPFSKLIGEVLRVMKEEGYIEDYEEVEDKKRETKYLRYFRVKLYGKINNCKAIKPRFSSKKEEWGPMGAEIPTGIWRRRACGIHT